MIILADGETLRRRYPGDLKGYGKGTLYMTDGRLAFETERHGLVMDIAFKYLMDWNAKGKRTLAFRWQEPPVRGADAQLTDPMFDAEVELGRKDGKRCDPEEARMALVIAYLEHYPYGVTGLGFYTNERGELRNRFDTNGKVYSEKFNEDAHWMVTKIWLRNELVRYAGGDPKMAEDAKEGFLEKNGGKTLIEQDIFRWLRTMEAHEADRSLSTLEGRPDPEQMKRNGRVGCAASHGDWIVKENEKRMIGLEEKIAKYKTAGNMDELNKVIPASPDRSDYVHKWSGGTMEDAVKWHKVEIVIVSRVSDILSHTGFDFFRQFADYEKRIKNEIAKKVLAGEDVSNYVPEVAKIESATVETENEIAGRRKLLVEAV